MRRALLLLLAAVILALGAACRPPAAVAPTSTPAPATGTPLPAAPPALSATLPAAPSPTPFASTATPIYAGPFSPPCGLSLPALPPDGPASATLTLTDEAALRALVPAAAWPAVEQLRDAPASVGLVAYQVGRQAEGIYWNADTPMPLASVAKVITLGLAEMLSGLTKEKQDEVLAGFAAAGKYPTAEECKPQIMSMTKSLTVAIFDKMD